MRTMYLKRKTKKKEDKPINIKKETEEQMEDERRACIGQIVQWKMTNPGAWLLVEAIPELKDILESPRSEWSLQEADLVMEYCIKQLKEMP